ncbi:ATP-dependent zinc protease family protein [Aquimarina agarilytica]|uniref:ATP-dependent zinc protease family protein n=1 Tax=Aquimarina agarilytica TaxID=1087449 RepID=UPI000289AFDE|nr:RimK/LysX family protein [Aquimarina agarilytica]
MEKKKIIIGRSDIADFTELCLYELAIKIDSGAYTSSIHCKNVVEINNVLHCQFLDETHEQFIEKKITFNTYKTTVVKSSNGISSKRYSIKTSITIFNKTYPITLTLNDRDKMRFPVLIGRKFLSGKFIIDPKQLNLSYVQKK